MSLPWRAGSASSGTPLTVVPDTPIFLSTIPRRSQPLKPRRLGKATGSHHDADATGLLSVGLSSFNSST
jgi:hypothetical protein